MSDPNGLLTSQEFAKQAGVSTSTVSKWLRSGKIKGSKEGGKWMISASQLSLAAASDETADQTAPAVITTAKKEMAAPVKKESKSSFSVDEFSALTYLTPFGVERFLREGRLTGLKSDTGQWQVDGSNLEKPDIQHLLRK